MKIFYELFTIKMCEYKKEKWKEEYWTWNRMQKTESNKEIAAIIHLQREILIKIQLAKIKFQYKKINN